MSLPGVNSIPLLKDERALRRLMDVAAIAREQSRLRATRRWEEASSVVEEFADLSAWAPNADVQVSGGKVYTAATPSGAGRAARALSLAAGSTLLIRARIVLAAAGGSAGTNNTMIGVARNTAGATPTSAADLFVAGITQDNRLATYDGTNTAIDIVAVTGTVYVTVMIDATTISAAVSTADGQREMSIQVARTAFAGGVVPNLALSVFDTRGTAGHAIDSVEFRTALVSPATADHALFGTPAPTPGWMVDSSGQRIYVSLPNGYRSKEPVPFVLHHHGHSGSEKTMVGTTGPQWNRVRSALNAAGIAVAGSQQHDNNWGSQAGIDDMLRLYRFVRDNFAMGPVVLTANSMGALTALSGIARREMPNVAGFYGVDPAISLASIWADGAGTYAPYIQTAFGMASAANYGAATDGFDPMLLEPWRFRGIPMRFAASAADTTVSKTANADAFAARVADWVPEATVVEGSGDHNSPTTLVPSDVLAFVQRCAAG